MPNFEIEIKVSSYIPRPLFCRFVMWARGRVDPLSTHVIAKRLQKMTLEDVEGPIIWSLAGKQLRWTHYCSRMVEEWIQINDQLEERHAPLRDFTVYLAYQWFLSGLKCLALKSIWTWLCLMWILRGCVYWVDILYEFQAGTRNQTPEAQCLTNLWKKQRDSNVIRRILSLHFHSVSRPMKATGNKPQLRTHPKAQTKLALKVLVFCMQADDVREWTWLVLMQLWNYNRNCTPALCGRTWTLLW